ICSLLFSKEGAVLCFLSKFRETMTGDIASAVSEILKVLCTLLKKRRKSSILQRYAKALLSQCTFIAKKASANNRSIAIEVIMVMVDPRNRYDPHELNVPALYEIFSGQYITEKKSAIVKAKILELLGTIARFYPQVVTETKLKTLKRWCFDSVTHQVSNQAKSAGEGNIISGGLTCINSLLRRPDLGITCGSEESNKLFDVLVKVLIGFKDATRFAAPLSALVLFRENAKLFGHLILPHCEKLYDCLQFWASHHNVISYKFGVAAYEEFLRQASLSVVLYENIEGIRETAIFAVNYNYLISYQNRANNNQRQYLRHLPAFIKSYTLFAEEFETVPVELMETIHQMCDIFITRYHDISGFYRRNGCLNIRNLLTMLYKKSEGVFGNFANAFFQKALICTCTTIRTLEEEEDRPLYTELLYFWEIILGRSRQQFMQVKTEEDPKQKEDEEEDEEDAVFESVNHFYQEIDTVDTEGLSEAIYDAFMANSLKLIKTFNLKLKNIDEDDVVSEEVNIVSKTLCPVNQKDFILFQNFVKFWSIIFEEIDHSRLTHWVYIASTTIIDQSVLHPLVSGFYRMQAGMMIVCERLQFFKRCHLFYTQAKSNTNKDILPKPQEYVTYLAIREYMKEVWHRLQQFTDELLASCLHLILSYPVEFFDIGELITPLEKALKLGITYHPLAAIAMDSLEKLLHPNLNYNIDSTFLSRILPCINEYLLVGVVSFNEEEGIKRKDLKIPTSQQRRYEVANTKKTAGQLGVVKRNYSDLPALQRRMMQFLGKLGGKNKQLLLKDDESLQDSGMLAWDPEKRVELRIPFKNVKVTIYLDEYLPRILNQAGPKKSLFHIFYLHIFPVMLKLANDPDQIAREMFQALYAQVIHWLTNNAQSENNETIALLQALLEASCSSDAGLRDYGAECIQEFVKWSIKQTSRSTDSAHNIRSLLRRLYNLMTSPSTSKRFGASLVFNRIYRLFREEPVLVNSYTLEILGQLFVSLKIAESDHPSVGTRDQIIEAISHIRRIIREKSSVFLIQNDRQAFIGNQSVNDLVSLVLWTFEQSGKLQRTYAKVCINFFTEFCVFLPGIKTPKQWLSAQLSANSLFLINIFETDQLKPPSVADDDDNQMMTIYLHWIKRLNSTVDGYIWLVERQIIDPFTLLGLPSSIFLLAVSFFVRNTPFDYLEEKLEESVIERNKLLSIYTHIATRLIYFFDLVLRSQEQGDQCYQYLERVFMDILCHKNFTNIVASTLLLPKETSETIQSYQGNAITQSGVKRMFDIAKSYILIMKEKSCWKFIDGLTVSIIKTLQSKKVDILIHASLEMERSVLIEVIQTVDGIRFLQSVGLFHLVCQQANELNEDYPKDATEYCKRLFDNYLKSCKKAEEPLQLQLTGNSIAICFTQLGFAKEYAPQLLGISGYLQPLEKIEKTEIFQKHAEYMVESIANHFEVFSLVFKENISSPVMREYLFLLFEFLESNKLSHRKLVWNITNHVSYSQTLS
ncbi:uncharacterized protein B0P05DRAFT_470219, partial [Gilbertella persicaria]|uniref:uncharacterized protein n=1 Tax=Gilbertella persicaria TaxID=101096 RepID=UPI002220E162